jgi:hypothetical protein
LAKITKTYEEAVKAELRVAWTAELLSAGIAMPDGTRTTWGDATLEQHRARHDMLAHSAQTNMENAARHALAMDLLEKTGSTNLNEVMSKE